MSAALTDVLGKIERFTSDSLAEFEQVVRDLADDREVPAERVLEVCESAGRSMSDLSAAVERLARRRQLAATHAEQDARTAARVKADRAVRQAEQDAERGVAAALAEVDRARLVGAQRVEQARVAAERARLAVEEAERAGEELLVTAPAALKRKLAGLRAERRGAESHAAQHREAIAKEDGYIRRAQAAIPPEAIPGVIRDRQTIDAQNRARSEAEEHARRVIAAATPRRAQAEAALERARDAVALLDGEIQAVLEEMLQP